MDLAIDSDWRPVHAMSWGASRAAVLVRRNRVGMRGDGQPATGLVSRYLIGNIFRRLPKRWDAVEAPEAKPWENGGGFGHRSLAARSKLVG
jgi:hypothetical protein